MKALGNRVLLQVSIIKRKIEQPDGTTKEMEDISREGSVFMDTNSLTSGNGQEYSLKKGDKVYYNPYGCVEIEVKSSKKAKVLCVDAEDVYAKL